MTPGGREDSRERKRSGPAGIPGPPELVPHALQAPSRSSPTPLLSAGGGGSESCAENLEVGGKKRNLQPSRALRGEGGAEGRAGEYRSFVSFPRP